MQEKHQPGKNAYLLKGTDADPYKAGPQYFDEHCSDSIRQKSLYNDHDRARVDNNQFFESRSNPLSSKGN